jgi:glycosyltransferase involved in cell wall biosynthesis
VKITIALPFVNVTGGVRAVLGLANVLHDRGHDVTVVYPIWPYRYGLPWQARLEEFQRHMNRPLVIPWFDLRCKLLKVPWMGAPFVPAADLVLATSSPVARSVQRLPRTCGRKVFLVFHDESDTATEHRMREALSYPFFRVTFSEIVRRELKQKFGVDMDAVLPLGVDRETFYPDAESRADQMVLMLHHDTARKGAGDGLKALELVREQLPSTAVVLCGAVRPQALPEWAFFDFHPSDAELRRLYSRATVLLYPSRYEGFGLPPLEAMACGCPTVTTAVGAIPEYASDGSNAFVVQPGDTGAMARALVELLGSRAERDRLSRAGLATAKRYALARTARLFEAACLKLLS